ncbi:hypothetical protein HED60_08685 [Planctomycetales bacterium ZRK34]|nr:hypothetical protein HED60_08685 [Planctomycetales bacterium ZRK34]
MSGEFPITILAGRLSRVCNFRVCCAVILLLGAVVAMVGQSRVPLEAHEVYVVSTAEHMRESGDWIVPRFNDELRLKKPPMNYWLTGLAGKLAGADSLEASHGRMVSATAAVALAGMTILIGTVLCGQSVGLLAGILCVSTRGFFIYSHNARPDMLYALWGAVMMAMFVLAWRRRSVWASYGMWAAFGLATLTKGPHVPAMLIGAFAITLTMHRPSRGRLLRVMRPVTGLLVAAAIALPWWGMLYLEIGDRLFESQLAGSRYMLGWSNVLDPYFFTHPFQWLMPWVILWPVAAATAVHRGRMGYPARMMALWIVVAAIALSFGGGKRSFYMLPLLPAACVWMAYAARRGLSWLAAGRRLGWVRRGGLLIGHALAAIGFLSVLWYIRWADDGMDVGDQWIVASGLAVMAVFVIGVMMATRWRDALTPRGLQRQLAAAAVVFSMLFIFGGAAAAMWSESRWGRLEISRMIREDLSPEVAVISYAANPRSIQFYCERIIHPTTLAELKARCADAHQGKQQLALILPQMMQDMIVSTISPASLEPVGTVPDCSGDQAWTLYRVK